MCAAVLALVLTTRLAFSADTPSAKAGASVARKDADAEWREVQQALRPPPPPVEWRTNPPAQQAVSDYEKQNGLLAGEAADKAKAFYTEFPMHPKADEARKTELHLLDVAIQLGSTNRQVQFDALRDRRLNDPNVPADEKFALQAQGIVKILESTSPNRSEALARAEKATLDLRKQFPKREEAYQLALMLANSYLEHGNVERARSVAADVEKNGEGDAKEEAQAQLRKIDRVGKPLDLRFTDLKGTQVNLKDYAGKVVLVDFWATWCGPCVAALPDVKETYTKYRQKGFEIIGISLDKEMDALTKFISEKEMSWPQYFDGLGWNNKFAAKFEITGVPALWLVDKKGNLRDLNGGASLGTKVEKLLAE